MYDHKGKVEVSAVLDEEELMNVAIEAGIDDFLLEEVGNFYWSNRMYLVSEYHCRSHPSTFL